MVESSILVSKISFGRVTFSLFIIKQSELIIITNKIMPLNHEKLCLYQALLLSFIETMFDRKLNRAFKILPTKSAMNDITKINLYMLALSIFDKTEFEKTNPLTKAKTIEAKIPRMVIY